jgi:hypothetical protein
MARTRTWRQLAAVRRDDVRRQFLIRQGLEGRATAGRAGQGRNRHDDQSEDCESPRANYLGGNALNPDKFM